MPYVHLLIKSAVTKPRFIIIFIENIPGESEHTCLEIFGCRFVGELCSKILPYVHVIVQLATLHIKYISTMSENTFWHGRTLL